MDNWAKVSILFQGEASNGEYIDKALNGECAYVFIVDDEGLAAASFGACGTETAWHLIKAFNDAADYLKNKYPTIALLDMMDALKNLHDKENDDERSIDTL